MTLLSNVTLAERMAIYLNEPWQLLQIDPFRPELLQPCSIDVELGDSLKIYTGPQTDTRRDNSPWWKALDPVGSIRDATGQLVDVRSHDEPPRSWVLQPGRFYLGVLRQFICVPEDCCGQLAGVSSRARDGILIHQQAGLLDPGWSGWATLEITVANTHTILYAGQRIGQVTFTLLDRRAEPPYHGRYQGDADPQPARFRAGVAA